MGASYWILGVLSLVASGAWSYGKGKPAAPSAPRGVQVQGEPAPAGESRIALVIGNGAYTSAPLANPVHDARDMGESLRRCGFSVKKLENATREQMASALREFGDRLLGGGVGLFFYAGHGMQVRGKNYLIPVNADILREDEVAYQALDADAILAKMETARNRMNILILDACRNNPFGRSSRSSAQGLAQMEAPKGTFIAFATAPGRTASDGNGKNGLYTRQLLEHITTPGLKLEDLFKRVRAGVMKASSEQQMPWDSSSLTGDFYFVTFRGKGAPEAPSGLPEETALDLAFWNSIKDSGRQGDFAAYLNRFPQGTFAELARSRMAALAKPGDPALREPESKPIRTQEELSTYLGVNIQDLDPAMREAFGVPGGVLVVEVEKGSPAGDAGLKPLDVVLQAGGVPMGKAAELVAAVRARRAGERLKLVIRRGQSPSLELSATLASKRIPPSGAFPAPASVPGALAPSEDPASKAFFDAFFGEKLVYGFAVGELTDGARKQHAIPGEVGGVLVASVEAGGPAKDLLAPGDVIQSVIGAGGSQGVLTLAQFRAAAQAASSAHKPLVLLIYRGALRQASVGVIPFPTPKP